MTGHEWWMTSLRFPLAVAACTAIAAQPAIAQPSRAKRDRIQRPESGEDAGPASLRPDLRGGPEAAEPGERPRLWSQWPEAQRRQIEKFIEENFPRMFVELQRIEDEHPLRYVRRMTRIAPQMRRIMETLRTDPQLGALMIRERQIGLDIWQTVARYHQAGDDATKRRLRAELEKLSAKAFDCRHERRELEVRQLEARLSVLKTRLAEADAIRDELIKGRVAELLERKHLPSVEDEELDGEPADERPDGARRKPKAGD